MTSLGSYVPLAVYCACADEDRVLSPALCRSVDKQRRLLSVSKDCSASRADYHLPATDSRDKLT